MHPLIHPELRQDALAAITAVETEVQTSVTAQNRNGQAAGQ